MASQRSEIFLILLILLFFSLALFFLILLIISRIKKKITLNKKKLFEPIAERLVFSVVFENKSFKDLQNDIAFTSNINNKFFRLLLLDSVIKLHRTYTGEYSKKTELFFIESNLIKDTYKKLNSRQWPDKCEAIRELAEMNITDAYSLIRKNVYSKNLTLRQEAMMAMLKLKGVDGLSFLNDYKETLNDWIQLNLISIIKNNFPLTQEPYYNLFIASSNVSVSLFGRRLKAYYEQISVPFSETN
ncbi:MAG: hypothetical protein V4549_09400 [Bacteroidota bacterium]